MNMLDYIILLNYRGVNDRCVFLFYYKSNILLLRKYYYILSWTWEFSLYIKSYILYKVWLAIMVMILQ